MAPTKHLGFLKGLSQYEKRELLAQLKHARSPEEQRRIVSSFKGKRKSRPKARSRNRTGYRAQRRSRRIMNDIEGH